MNDDITRSVLIKTPPKLKRKLVRVVRQLGTNLNDLIVGTLAEHYNVPFVPSGRPSQPGTDSPYVVLRMSDEVKYTIQLDALTRRSNMTDTIVRILAAEFNVDLDLRAPTRTCPFGGGRLRARSLVEPRRELAEAA